MFLQVIVQEYVIDSSGEDVMVELRERSHFWGAFFSHLFSMFARKFFSFSFIQI
jgi:hypothetical protein